MRSAVDLWHHILMARRPIAFLVFIFMAALALPMSAAVGATEQAKLADYPGPEPGTKTVWRLIDDKGERSVTHTVLADRSDFEGSPAFRETDGDIVQVFNAVTNNWMATYASDGQLSLSAKPDSGTYNWPIWVGKQWLASYTYTDHVQRKTISPVVRNWQVLAYESVTVPAGTFDAYVLEGAPVPQQGWKRQLWYVPELGMHVKHVQQRGDAVATAELILIFTTAQ